jgi:hypothetical protein
MRKLGLLLLGLIFTAGLLELANAKTYTDNVALNYARPCSYTGKTPTRLTITAASAVTGSALNRGVYRMVCTSAVYFRTASATTTALTTDTYLPADQVEWFVSEGDFVAAIRVSADGTCYLTECR